MITLYIDTTSSYLYTGIVKNDELLACIKEKFEYRLSEETLPSIVSLFSSTNIKPNDIQKIIVVNGPGSFTGIRVGLTIAKVYAWTLNIPITTITSLEAMAVSCSENTHLVPIIDARRGYVYAAIYDAKMNVLMKESYISLEELYKNIPEDFVFITKDEIELKGKKCDYNPNILAIVQKYNQKDCINPHLVNPQYLKLTEAEENR